MGFSLRCPLCRQKFRWDDPTKGMPKECKVCGEEIGNTRADDDIAAPSLRSMKTTATDQVYESVFKASEERMYQAAEMAGVHHSEMASLKITDLNDAKYPGEIAAKRDVDAERRLGIKDGQNLFQGNGTEHSGDVMTGAVNVNGQIYSGIAPNAGAHAMMNLRGVHSSRMAGHLAGSDVLSDRPANETMSPNYRPRV